MTWDITMVRTLAQSYLHASGHSAAVSRKQFLSALSFFLYQSVLFLSKTLSYLVHSSMSCLQNYVF